MKLLSLLLLFALLNSVSKAQDNSILDFGEAYFNDTNGPEYFKPLVNGLNNSLHSGLFPSSDFSNKFHFYIGVNANISFIKEKDWYFEGVTELPYEPETKREVATVFGPNSAEVLQSSNGEVYVFPGGFEMDKLLLGIPQISIGGFANTNVTFRFMATSLDKELNDLSLFGVGVQHNLSPYFGFENFALNIEGSYHKFKMGDWMSSDFIMVRSSIAKSFNIFRAYGFLGYQNGQAELMNESKQVVTTSKADNFLLFGIGGALELAFINLNLECIVNSYISLNAGLGLKF